MVVNWKEAIFRLHENDKLSMEWMHAFHVFEKHTIDPPPGYCDKDTVKAMQAAMDPFKNSIYNHIWNIVFFRIFLSIATFLAKNGQQIAVFKCIVCNTR